MGKASQEGQGPPWAVEPMNMIIYCYLTKYRISSVEKSPQECKAHAKGHHILMQTHNSFKFLFVDEMAVKRPLDSQYYCAV
jgi:hypothetical protein